MKIPMMNFGKVLLEDIARAKESIAKGRRESIKQEVSNLNGIISQRPSSVKPMEAKAEMIVQEADIALLPGQLPLLVKEIAPRILKTDNVFRETYSAAKRLNIDASTVRANLKSILEAATFLAKANPVLAKQEEVTATRVAAASADQLLKGFNR